MLADDQVKQATAAGWQYWHCSCLVSAAACSVLKFICNNDNARRNARAIESQAARKRSRAELQASQRWCSSSACAMIAAVVHSGLRGCDSAGFVTETRDHSYADELGRDRSYLTVNDGYKMLTFSTAPPSCSSCL